MSIKTVLFVIEYSGKLILNNELIVNVTLSEPLVVEWFPDNDFIIENQSAEKIFINTSTVESIDSAQIIKIEPNIYIIRPFGKLAKNNSKENIITADSVEYSPAEIIAVKNIGTLMGHVRITKFNIKDGKMNLAETYIATSVSKSEIPAGEIPRAFLQCVSLRDFGNARSLLSFEITDKHLGSYFGEEFEILSENYLKQKNVVSIVASKKTGYLVAKNITFQIENEKIINVC